MNNDADYVISQLHALLTRMRSRERAADVLHRQATEMKIHLQSMQQYDENLHTFAELSNRANRLPRGQMFLCLTLENKQLEQLRMENDTLRSSLEEHQMALELMMSKYRDQMSTLMRINQVENVFQTPGSLSKTIPKHLPIVLSDHTTVAPEGGRAVQNSNGNRDSSEVNTTLSDSMATLIALTRDVGDRGDAYAMELEREVQRLRAENDGLREVLLISPGQTTAAGVESCVNDWLQSLSEERGERIKAPKVDSFSSTSYDSLRALDIKRCNRFNSFLDDDDDCDTEVENEQSSESPYPLM